MTHGQTDVQTDRQGDSSIPPNFVCGGLIKKKDIPPRSVYHVKNDNEICKGFIHFFEANPLPHKLKFKKKPRKETSENVEKLQKRRKCLLPTFSPSSKLF